MKLNQQEKTSFYCAIRVFIYFLLMMCFIGAILHLASIYKEDTFNENSVVENIQLGILLLTGGLFLSMGISKKEWRPLMFFLSALCLLASCRELDKTLDKLILGMRWRIGFIFPISAICYALKHKEKAMSNLFSFIGSSSFYLMFCALIIIFPIAQCIGHRSLILNVLGKNNLADIKELFEECAEVMGYFLILLASIESYISLVRKK